MEVVVVLNVSTPLFFPIVTGFPRKIVTVTSHKVLKFDVYKIPFPVSEI